MNSGPPKHTAEGRETTPHHVRDRGGVTDPASVAEYQRLARQAIDGILARGRVPLLVGGSGLYVRAVLERFEFPGTDPDLRAELEAELARAGAAPLYERLRTADPTAAAGILPSHGRRIGRALEDIALTGRGFSATLPASVPFYPFEPFGVVPVNSAPDH